jgi:hypothetical protein
MIRANAPISSAPDRVRRDGRPLRSARRRLSRTRIPVGQRQRTPGSAADRVPPPARTVRRATHRLSPAPGQLDQSRGRLGPTPRSLPQSAERPVPPACTVISTGLPGHLCGLLGRLCSLHGHLCDLHGRLYSPHGHLCSLHGRLCSLHGYLYGLHDHPGRQVPSSLQPARSSARPYTVIQGVRRATEFTEKAKHNGTSGSAFSPAPATGGEVQVRRSLPLRCARGQATTRRAGRRRCVTDHNHFAFCYDIVSRGH